MLQNLNAECNCRNRHLEQIGRREIWMIRTFQERLCWSPESIEIITKSLLHDVASLKNGVATSQLSLKSQEVSAPYFKCLAMAHEKPEGGFRSPPPGSNRFSALLSTQSKCSVKQRREWPPRRLRLCHKNHLRLLVRSVGQRNQARTLRLLHTFAPIWMRRGIHGSPHILNYGWYRWTIPNRGTVAARGLMLRGDVSIGRKDQIPVSMKPGVQNWSPVPFGNQEPINPKIQAAPLGWHCYRRPL